MSIRVPGDQKATPRVDYIFVDGCNHRVREMGQSQDQVFDHVAVTKKRMVLSWTGWVPCVVPICLQKKHTLYSITLPRDVLLTVKGVGLFASCVSCGQPFSPEAWDEERYWDVTHVIVLFSFHACCMHSKWSVDLAANISHIWGSSASLGACHAECCGNVRSLWVLVHERHTRSHCEHNGDTDWLWTACTSSVDLLSISGCSLGPYVCPGRGCTPVSYLRLIHEPTPHFATRWVASEDVRQWGFLIRKRGLITAWCARHIGFCVADLSSPTFPRRCSSTTLIGCPVHTQRMHCIVCAPSHWPVGYSLRCGALERHVQLEQRLNSESFRQDWRNGQSIGHQFARVSHDVTLTCACYVLVAASCHCEVPLWQEFW